MSSILQSATGGHNFLWSIDLSQGYLQVTLAMLHYSLPDPRWWGTSLHISDHGSLSLGRVLPRSDKPNYQRCSVELWKYIWQHMAMVYEHGATYQAITPNTWNSPKQWHQAKTPQMLLWSTWNQRHWPHCFWSRNPSGQQQDWSSNQHHQAKMCIWSTFAP